eukprot:1160184-Pelagomonas_calceolata.AAC.3
MWVQLLPIKLPGREEGMRLHYTHEEAAPCTSRRGRDKQGEGQGRGRREGHRAWASKGNELMEETLRNPQV